MSLRLVLISLSISLLTGCSNRVSVQELVGTYKSENPEGYSLLTLRADMQYTQTIHYDDDGRDITVSDKWTYEPQWGVSLENGYAVTHEMLGWKLPTTVRKRSWAPFI